MTPQDEAAFEAKAEKMLAGQRECPTGRNFLAWTMRYQNNEDYRGGFDATFQRSPGSCGWFEDRFCSKCGIRKTFCSCGGAGK